jgi:hypothetical protein
MKARFGAALRGLIELTRRAFQPKRGPDWEFLIMRARINRRRGDE